jgi:hypothetical protein
VKVSLLRKVHTSRDYFLKINDLSPGFVEDPVKSMKVRKIAEECGFHSIGYTSGTTKAGCNPAQCLAISAARPIFLVTVSVQPG